MPTERTSSQSALEHPRSLEHRVDRVPISEHSRILAENKSVLAKSSEGVAWQSEGAHSKAHFGKNVEGKLSGRGRMGRLPGFRIAATGSFLPPDVVTNQDLSTLGCDSDWIVQRTGIRERRRAAEGVSSSDLAYEAAMACLKQAEVAPHEVDLVVLATITPDHPTPSTACRLQERLGCVAPAFDVNAACAGFMYAMSVAGHFVASGMARRALVVGSEVMSRTVNPTDVRTYPLFGDGAGAVLLVPAEANDHTVGQSVGTHPASGFLGYTLGAEGHGGDLLCIPGGGSREPLDATKLAAGRQYFKMDGKPVFKWAVRTLVDSIRDVLSFTGIEPSEIDQFILHQANVRIIDAAMESLGCGSDRVFINLDRYGNTSAASIAIALDEAASGSRIKRGDLLLLSGFGAGLTWGTSLMYW